MYSSSMHENDDYGMSADSEDTLLDNLDNSGQPDDKNGDPDDYSEEDGFTYISKLEFTFIKPDISLNSTCSTVEDFLSLIKSFRIAGTKEKLAYRGSAKIEYEFEPSLFRKEYGIKNERYYYGHAIQLAPEEFTNMSAFDILCKMQHYSIPTRLLDLTSNPLIALWFACEKEKEKDGKVEVVSGTFYRSDIHEIQIICSIGDFLSRYLDDPKKPSLRLETFRDYLMKKNIWCYSDRFERYLNAVLELKFIGIRPNYSHQRLKAQQGLFMLFGCGKNLSEMKENSFPINKPGPKAFDESIFTIKIPSKAKEKILEQLAEIGFDKSRIFPELEHISEYVKYDLVK
jgi:hypothetical protein